MNIAFFGATRYSVDMYRAITDAGYAVPNVFTLPKKIDISYSSKGVDICTFADINEEAKKRGSKVAQVDGRIGDYAGQLSGISADIFLVYGWYHMLQKEIRQIPPKGCIGIHHSLLPKYRGGAPLVWSMINGEPYAGTTLFYLEDGVDTGDIIDQRKFEIRRDDTINEVYNRAHEHAVAMVIDSLPKLASGSAARVSQDHSSATIYPQRCPEDGAIDWSRPVKEINDFIRAQTRPYPGAFTYVDGKKIVMWDAEVHEE